MERLARRFRVSGVVQGVGYRFFVEHAATGLGVSGYVKNLFDGRVEVYAIGSASQLAALKQDLHHGPQAAVVNDVAETGAEIDPELGNGFTIERND